jgi:hypothetical protein
MTLPSLRRQLEYVAEVGLPQHGQDQAGGRGCIPLQGSDPRSDKRSAGSVRSQNRACPSQPTESRSLRDTVLHLFTHCHSPVPLRITAGPGDKFPRMNDPSIVRIDPQVGTGLHRRSSYLEYNSLRDKKIVKTKAEER